MNALKINLSFKKLSTHWQLIFFLSSSFFNWIISLLHTLNFPRNASAVWHTGRSFQTKCSRAEIIMAWNKPAFSKFYSTKEQQTFPNIRTVFIHLSTLPRVSEESKLDTESTEERRILHDTPLSLQQSLVSSFQS